MRNFFDENYKRWADKYYEQRLEYNATNIGTVVYEIYLKGSDGSLSYVGSTPNTTFNTSLSNGTSATFVVKSAYTIFKNNASTGSEITVKISPSIPGGDGDDNDNDNDNVDDENQDKDDDSDNENQN